ncbi:MAG: histidine phosphatase family protein [Alphaproteobacteria bacterium]|nr:histidine phosphatase family protein [Alphaproteobacteria bacterium]
MTRLYLIRHGRPGAVWGGSDPDPGLDATGHAQARKAAQALLALPEAERPIRVVSSPLRRCRETAAPLAEALGAEVRIDPLVGEIPTPRALTAPERGPWLREAMAGTWAGIVGDLDYEAWRAGVAAAVLAAAEAGPCAVFSHFVAINGVLSLLAGRAEVIVLRPDHASCTVLEAGPEGLRLIQAGPEAATSVA